MWEVMVMAEHMWLTVVPEIRYQVSGGGAVTGTGPAYRRCAACGLRTDLEHPPEHACDGEPQPVAEAWLIDAGGVPMILYRVDGPDDGR